MEVLFSPSVATAGYSQDFKGGGGGGGLEGGGSHCVTPRVITCSPGSVRSCKWSM